MSHYFQTEAITLHRKETREDNRFLSFYTLEHGRIDALATGARKITSRLAGHLEPFGIINLGLVRGPKNIRVTSAQTVERYEAIYSDLELVTAAGFCLRFIYSLVKGGAPDARIFFLLKEALTLLNTGAVRGQLKIFNAVFTLRAMSLLGYHPELSACLACRRAVAGEGVVFIPARGGVMCQNCPKPDHIFSLPLHADELSLFFSTSTIPFRDIFSLPTEPRLHHKLNASIIHFFTYHLR